MPKDLFLMEGERTGALCLATDDGIIAVLENTPLQGIDQQKNGEYILRACNAHDDLLAACKAALKISSLSSTTSLEVYKRRCEIESQIRAAIAKAVGEAKL